MKVGDIHIGQKFDRLKVIGLKGMDQRGNRLFLVDCKCKKRQPFIVAGWSLLANNVRSCGCLRNEPRTHGMSGTPEYKTWENIHSRCKDPRFKNYHGRGITVCKRWKKFENFYADMGQRPSSGHSIDRKNSNKNYTPKNCRWATRAEQEATKRPYVRFSQKGRHWKRRSKQTLAQASYR